MDEFSEKEQHFIFEVIKKRYDMHSRIFCTQYKAKFLQKRKKDVKPHMDKLHAWLVDNQFKCKKLGYDNNKGIRKMCR